MNELRHATTVAVAYKYLAKGALDNPENSTDALHIAYIAVKPREFRSIVDANEEWEKIFASPLYLMMKHGMYADAFLTEPITTAIAQKKNEEKQEVLNLLVNWVRGDPIQSTWQDVGETEVSEKKTFSSKIKELCEGPDEFELNNASMEIIDLVETQLTDLINGIENRLGSRPKFLPVPIPPSVAKHTPEYVAANAEAENHQKKLFADFLALQDILSPAFPAMKVAMRNVFDILRSGWLSEKVDLQDMAINLEHMEANLLNMDAPEMNIVICGETCTGKSTVLEGILGSPCLPTNVHPNTACPIRILVNNELVGPVMFIPSIFCCALNCAMANILDSLVHMKNHCVPYDDIQTSAAEAKEIFDHLAASVAFENPHDHIYEFSTHIEGASNIQACINKINGIIRLVYVLKAIPRFRVRLCDTHPLSVLLIGPVVSKLPTISSPCSCTFGLPLYGKLSFIDTPGVSEYTGDGSFMAHIDGIMNRLLSEASSIILLTTPDKTSNKAFRDWRRKAITRRPDATIIVINKFDQVRDADVAVKLGEFRRAFRNDGGIKEYNVQQLRANVLHNVVWGCANIMETGGLERLQLEGDTEHLDTFGQDLFKALYGEATPADWTDTIDNLKVLFQKYKDNYARKSNFGTVLALCVLPTIIRTAVTTPAAALRYVRSLVSRVLTPMQIRHTWATNRANRAPLLEVLNSITGEVQKLLETGSDNLKDTIKTKVEASFKEKITWELQPMVEMLKEDVRACIAAKKAECKPAEVMTREVEYIIGGQVKRESVQCDVWFFTETEAERVRASCVNAVNRVLQLSHIGKEIEKFRRDCFAEEIVSACDKLRHTVENDWAQNLEDAKSAGVDVGHSFDSPELVGLKECCRNELTHLPELIKLKLEPDINVLVEGGIGKMTWHFLWLFPWRYYFVLFDIIERCVIEHIEDTYDLDRYVESQVKRGRTTLEKAIGALENKLNGIKRSTEALLQSISSNTVDDDPEVLAQYVTLLTHDRNEHSTYIAQLEANTSYCKEDDMIE